MDNLTVHKIGEGSHLTSPTVASAKAYFWRCGLIGGRRWGHPQAAGTIRLSNKSGEVQCDYPGMQGKCLDWGAIVSRIGFNVSPESGENA